MSCWSRALFFDSRGLERGGLGMGIGRVPWLAAVESMGPSVGEDLSEAIWSCSWGSMTMDDTPAITQSAAGSCSLQS